jgi:hypothetical protein
MPSYTMQDALNAEQRVKDAEAYNQFAARNWEIAQRQATELHNRSDALRLAAAQEKRPVPTERGPEANSR